MDLRTIWERYLWIVALVVMAVIVLRAFLGREPFCGSIEENCAREWITALGGYLAVGAAFLTIKTMVKDRRIVEQHQRQNVKISLMGHFALANAVRNMAMKGAMNDHLAFMSRHIRENPQAYGMHRDDLRREIELMISVAQGETMRRFNETIRQENFFFSGRFANSLHLLETGIGMHDAALGSAGNAPVKTAALANILDSILQSYRDLLADRDAVARNFLQEWEQPTNAHTVADMLQAIRENEGTQTNS